MYYLVLTQRTSAFDAAVIEPHYSYLTSLREQGKLVASGPFFDKSGGAYLLAAESLSEASAVAQSDPLFVHGASTVKVWEWQASSADFGSDP